MFIPFPKFGKFLAIISLSKLSGPSFNLILCIDCTDPYNVYIGLLNGVS